MCIQQEFWIFTKQKLAIIFYALFQLFDKEELGKLVSFLRDSAISLLDEGYEPFGFETLNVYAMDKWIVILPSIISAYDLEININELIALVIVMSYPSAGQNS